MPLRDSALLYAWGAFFEGHALAIRSIGSQIERTAPLTLDEYDLLLTLKRAPKFRIRLASLADAAIFSRSGITRVVQRLARRGFLRREKCKSDGRGAFAVLTAEGVRALDSTWSEYSKAILTILGPIYSTEDAEKLQGLLERLIGELRQAPLISISSRKTVHRKSD